MAPLIGISSWRGTAPTDGFEVPHLLTHAAYARAVEKAGGLTVVLPELGPASVDALLDRVDGVVLVGGPDVDPARYGEPPLPTTGAAAGRDAFDLALARRCVERDHPLLAICRGLQVLNVALGGSLTQHVPEHMRRDRAKDDVHVVTLDPGSRCATGAGAPRVLGVQWHPELLRHRPDHFALFVGLVRTAEAVRASR